MYAQNLRQALVMDHTLALCVGWSLWFDLFLSFQHVVVFAVDPFVPVVTRPIVVVLCV